MRKICVVTGTRAEYGLLKPVIKRIVEDKELQLLLYVTGAHLVPEFGLTYKEIENDGIPISRKIEMLLSSDTPCAVTKSMGVELLGIADALQEDVPNLIILLGDRYEILVAAMAAMLFRIPIAHIHGGETTIGAIDESIRHSITKMSQLHFATTEEYKKRIIQLGENPKRVFNTGALGVENIKQLKLLSKQELEKQIKFNLDGDVIMVTYHPVTLEGDLSIEEQVYALLEVIEKHTELKIIFTKANADAGGRAINKILDEFYKKNSERCIVVSSLGQLRYLSAHRVCKVVVGNSSSGIIEAPSLGIPTINIGDRQAGRVRAESVIDCSYDAESIEKALEQSLSADMQEKAQKVANPYEGQDTSRHIVKIIKEYMNKKCDIQKKFYDIPFENLEEGK